MDTTTSPYLNWTDKIEISKNHYLPHWNACNKYQFVTFRLGDSLPQNVLGYYKKEKEKFYEQHPQPWDNDVKRQYSVLITNRISTWLDAGYGHCILKHQEAQEIIINCLEHDNHIHYELTAYVIMPNHIHILYRTISDRSVAVNVMNWKRITSRRIMKAYDLTEGLWCRDYHDTLIRNEKHLMNVINYIYCNPKNVKDGDYRLWIKEVNTL